MSTVLPYIEIVLGIILVALILLQRSGAAQGGALGSSENLGSVLHTRRGLEKTFFTATIVTGVLFALVSFAMIFV